LLTEVLCCARYSIRQHLSCEGYGTGTTGTLLGEGTMRRMLSLGIALSFAVTTAQAAGTRPGCYSNADIEASLAVRFQAQLMVLSDICRDTSYGEFAQRNKDTIISYQKQMIDHFRRAGERRADISFENYMTRLANEASLGSGHRTVGEVCQSS